MRTALLSAVGAFALVAAAPAAHADMAAAERWIADEFQPSTLSMDEQKSEMQWFIDAAKPFAGMEINVLSETIPTHEYESKVLTKAFEEITGIKVNHQLLGDVVRWPAAGAIASAPDGEYVVGVRPHFVSPIGDGPHSVPVTGQVQITELSGSESIAHFDLDGRSWVSQSHGVHPYRVGETHRFNVDTRGCLYFRPDGARVAA